MDAAARFQLLYDLGCAFAARLELDELVPLVLAKCREVVDAEGAAVLLLDRERNDLYFPYVAEEDPEVADRLMQLRLPADRGIAGTVLQSGEALRVDDVSADPRFYAAIDAETGLSTRSMLSCPLGTRRGTIGVIQVVNHRGGTFTDDHLALLTALSGSVAVAIENAQLWAEAKAAADRLRAEVGVLRRDLAHRQRFDMIGTGAAMTEVFRLMESAAASPITVLVEGETGTGKELVARGIHGAGARASAPFVAVNCAALPETLLESELFGHRRGAFTGATHDQRGLFEAASGGTIFLDEIGDMPLPMQAKLLRVLQEGEVTPVGDRQPRKIDVRVISATNHDLVAEVAAKRFRDDLYYRLGAFPIRLPPLRERREDVPLLADHFLAAAAERHRKRIAGIDPAAVDLLARFDWPGNVRELRNEIERAVALAADGAAVGPAHLTARVARAAEGAAEAPRPVAADAADVPRPAPAGRTAAQLREARAAFEVEFVTKVLREHGGNVTHAAQALGISRVALQKKMKEFGLR
jgi:Nif-specific regulatory protein